MAGSPLSYWPRLDKAHFVAMILETCLLGIYFNLIWRTFEVLGARSNSKKAMLLRPMPIAAIIIFISIMGNWVTETITAWHAFILAIEPFCFDPAQGEYLPAVRKYMEVWETAYVANSGFYVAGTLVADAFMIYRLFVTWEYNSWIIVPPSIMCLTLAATGTMVTLSFAKSTTQAVYDSAGAWITASFALTFVCNLYSTSLIAYKVWESNRRLQKLGVDCHGGSNIAEILVESAALYSFCLIISLITYAVGSNIVFISVAATNPVIGIIFCMIVTRVHDGKRRAAAVRSGIQTIGSGRTNGIRVSTKQVRHIDEPDIDLTQVETRTSGTPEADDKPRLNPHQVSGLTLTEGDPIASGEAPTREKFERSNNMV